LWLVDWSVGLYNKELKEQSIEEIWKQTVETASKLDWQNIQENRFEFNFFLLINIHHDVDCSNRCFFHEGQNVKINHTVHIFRMIHRT